MTINAKWPKGQMNGVRGRGGWEQTGFALGVAGGKQANLTCSPELLGTESGKREEKTEQKGPGAARQVRLSGIMATTSTT